MTDTYNPPDKKSAGLAQWLITKRVNAGLNQEALAQRAGVTQATISNIETGRSRNPHAVTWGSIVAALRPKASVVAAESADREKGAAAAPAETQNTSEKAAAELAKTASEEARIEGIGELVDFEPHDDDKLPAEPGVYIFYDVTDRPTYIGQSKNIRTRIRGKHDEKFWYREPIVNTAAYIRIEDEMQRKQIEKLLITVLRSHALINKAHVQRGVEEDDE